MKQFIAALLVVNAVISILNRRSLLFIHKKQKKIMTEQEKFSAQLDRIDTATTNIANELRDLKGQIAGQGLPADQEQSVLARLTAAADKLEGIGATEQAAGQGAAGSTTDTAGTGTPEATGSTTGTSGDQSAQGTTGATEAQASGTAGQ